MSVSKAGRRGASAVAHGHDAEQGAHLIGRDQARQCRVDGTALRLARARLQCLCTLHDAQPLQEVALPDRSEGRYAGGFGEGPKIYMRAQVGLAGPIKKGRAREQDYWTPKNYDGTEGGTLTLRRALENSEVQRFREVFGGEVRTVRDLK